VFDYIDNLIDTRIESLYVEIDIKVLELMDTIENLTSQNTKDEKSSPKAKRGKTEKVFKIKNTEIDLNKIGFVLPQFINEKINEDDWEKLLQYLCNSLKV
jgi:hypothetical protein